MHKCGLVLLMIGLMLLATSCGNRLLVPGLTMPPGSVEVSFTNGTTAANPMATVGMPALGEIKREVMVCFNNTAGWDTVANHIDSCMNKAGYSETISSLDQMLGETKLPAGADTEMYDKMSQMMRMYSKQGGRFAVVVMNNNGMMGGAGMPGMDTSAMGMGDFTLTVIEYKGD